MATLTFRGPNLARVAAFAAERKAPILIVKDDGIYLVPRGGGNADPTKAVVCYADGFNPAGQDRGTLFDKTHAAVGGDDFAETMPCNAALLREMQIDGAALKIRLNAHSVSVTLSLPAGGSERAARHLTQHEAEKEVAKIMKRQFIAAMPDGRLPVWNMRKGDGNDSRTFALWHRGCDAKYPGAILLNEQTLAEAGRLYREALAKPQPGTGG